MDRIPELLGEIERLREPTTSAAAQSSVRRTSVRFVDSSRPEGPRPEGPCPGEPQSSFKEAAMTVTHARGAGAFPRRGRG